MTETRMPALFVGHGSPMNALEDNRHTRSWETLGSSLPRPAAILSISAHWYTDGTRVTAAQKPHTIHDFHGFPRALYQCDYPASGAPALAREIRDMLRPLEVTASGDRGLDHGTWSVLMRMYPEADIPVVQLSIDARRPPEFHYRLGQQLEALRKEGVLLFGSGNVVHNLAQIQWHGDMATPAWAEGFEQFVRTAIESGDRERLIHYRRACGDARLAVPTEEHYLPLLYIAGAAGADSPSFPTAGVELGSISMLSVLYRGG